MAKNKSEELKIKPLYILEECFTDSVDSAYVEKDKEHNDRIWLCYKGEFYYTGEKGYYRIIALEGKDVQDKDFMQKMEEKVKTKEFQENLCNFGELYTMPTSTRELTERRDFYYEIGKALDDSIFKALDEIEAESKKVVKKGNLTLKNVKIESKDISDER